MGKVLGNALKTNGTLMSIRAYSQEQFDALEELDDNTIYLIGVLVAVNYTITNNLTNCTTNNPADSIDNGSSYIAEITANFGFALDSVSIVMGGVDVTSEVYSNGEINIPSVTGNIVITIAAAALNLPVMSGLGVWLDAKDNLNDGSYHAGATKWVSKVECGSLGNIEFSLLGEVSFVDGVARFAPTKSTVTSIWSTNPLCENGLGAIGSGDITVEIVLDSQFNTYTISGDSIYFVGCNTAPNGSGNPVGRWRFGLYNKTNKNLDIWCNDGSGKFATLSNSMPAAGKQTLCFVRQNGVITFYRNGVSLGSVEKAQTFSSSETTAFAIGNQASGQTQTGYYNCLIGDVYDVKVYGRALTAEEVAFNHDFNNTHYNLGL